VCMCVRLRASAASERPLLRHLGLLCRLYVSKLAGVELGARGGFYWAQSPSLAERVPSVGKHTLWPNKQMS
jgi:hypothetical protein